MGGVFNLAGTRVAAGLIATGHPQCRGTALKDRMMRTVFGVCTVANAAIRLHDETVFDVCAAAYAGGRICAAAACFEKHLMCAQWPN
jgi:hypothetical protein